MKTTVKKCNFISFEKSNLIYKFFILLILITFQSCINIKSDFPEIVYYKLVQTPIDEAKISSFAMYRNIYIKPFSVNSNLETEKIVVSETPQTVKKYNYHQWTASLSEVITEFTVDRFSKYGVFKHGILTSMHTVAPDLVLECKILDCSINNFVTTEKSNTVELSISVNLLTSETGNLEYLPIFSKTYTKSMIRKNNSLESAVEALSLLISEINDEIIADIYKNH